MLMIQVNLLIYRQPIMLNLIIVLEKDSSFKKSEIIIADFDLLCNYLYELPNTKWVQGTWAGIDKLIPQIESSKPIPFQMTRFTGEHFGKLMGEYVVANIVNHERNFFELKSHQQKQQWHREGKVTDYRAISDLTVGVLGLGHIGNRGTTSYETANLLKT
jgi:phosphoglycerate dehydrogenase-like enzyme